MARPTCRSTFKFTSRNGQININNWKCCSLRNTLAMGIQEGYDYMYAEKKNAIFDATKGPILYYFLKIFAESVRKWGNSP